MKRWFISKMGNYDAEEPDVRCPKIVQYTRSWRAWSANARQWCFGQCAASDFTAIQADPDIYVLPDGAMDMSVGSIPAGVRTTLRTKLEAAGMVFTDVKTSWTVRQLLVYILRQIQPALDSVESCDVADVEQ